MATQKVKRKLTAILSADVEGYGRLMGEDEESTVRTLTTYREIMSGLIQQYRGRVVDYPGDNILAEFTSVVDAVQCGVEIQQVLKARNAALPESRRMEFRIGVNLGDVIEEGERIYGDGVNIAARLEAMAEGGGVCISGSAYDQIKNKLALGYEYLGEKEVKNIAEPVRVYKAQIEPVAKRAGKKAGLGRWRWAVLSVATVLVIGAGIVAVWNFYFRPSPPSVEPASVEKMKFPLPDKPSLAVLPFTNMSDDPKQEYFSDGLSEDLITDLSRISGLFVIARNSTFAYKGKAMKIRQVAEELGVRYVLEGSVRKADNRVRINVQLIDATTGHHLWAQRYDGEMVDVFNLQDEITRKIIAALEVKLKGDRQEQDSRKGTDNIEAYDAFLQGWKHYRRSTTEDWGKAISYLKKP
jgi:TolB-like protein/class 3 adenylate cyclase